MSSMDFIIMVGVSSLIAAIITIVCFLLLKAMAKKNTVREEKQSVSALENDKYEQFRKEVKDDLGKIKNCLSNSQKELHNRLVMEVNKGADYAYDFYCKVQVKQQEVESVQKNQFLLLEGNERLIKKQEKYIQQLLEKLEKLEKEICSLNEKLNQSMSEGYDQMLYKSEEKNEEKKREEKSVKLELHDDEDKLRYFKVEDGGLKETQNEKALFVWKSNPDRGNKISYQFNEKCNKYEACNKLSELSRFCDIELECKEQDANVVKATDEWGKATYCNGKVDIIQKSKIRFIKE